MPRRSADALAVATIAKIDVVQRPDAPYDLTDEESAEWWAVVQRMPADWFPRESHGLLTQYCRHVVRSRRVAQLIGEMEKSKDLDVKEYRDLIRTESDLSRAMALLATKMRMAQQSTYDATKTKPRTIIGKKPWEK